MIFFCQKYLFGSALFTRTSNKFSMYRHFICNDLKSCSRYSLWYSTYFIKYSTWFDDGYPIFRRSLGFPRTHTYFCRSRSNRFVGKYTYPYFYAATSITSNCSSSCFYLPRCDPNRFQCLKSKSTKTNAITPRRYSLDSSPMLVTKFRSFWVLVDGCIHIILFEVHLYFRTGYESFFSSGSLWRIYGQIR